MFGLGSWARRATQEQKSAEQEDAEEKDADNEEEMMEKLFYKAIHRDGFATWLTKLDEVEDDEAKRLLGWAAAHGVTDKGVISAIAERCSDVSAYSLASLSPLQLAARARNVPAIEQLLAIGANVNGRSGDHSAATALHLAVRECCLGSVVALLAVDDVDVDVVDSDDKTPLHLCAEAWQTGKGQAEGEETLAKIAVALITGGADMKRGTPEDPRETPLRLAIEANACVVVAEMLRLDDKPPPPYASSYMEQVRQGGEKYGGMLKVLVDAGWGPGADVDAAATSRAAKIAATLFDINKSLRTNPTAGFSQRSSGDVAPGKSYPLHDAAKSGNLEALSKLLSSGEDVNAADRLGGTALHAAAMHGHDDVVDALLKAEGIAVDKPDRSKLTPLYRAAVAERARAVKALIKAGASPRVKKDGESILEKVLHKPAGAVLEALLAGGALPPSGGEKGYTPLHIACENDAPGTVEALLRAGALPGHCWNNALRSPLMIACHHGRLNAVRQLLPKLSKRQINMRSSFESGAKTALVHALRGRVVNSDTVAIVEALLDAGADPHIPTLEDHLTALPAALATPSIATNSTIGPLLVRALVVGGANANEFLGYVGCTPFHVACKMGACAEVIQALLDVVADATVLCPGIGFSTPLLLAACYGGNVGAVRLLINQPQSGGLNAVGGTERDTALSAAVFGGQTKVVRFLLEEGADMDLLPCEDGKTPVKTSLIEMAAMGGHLDVMNLLIQAKMFKDRAEREALQKVEGADVEGAGKDAPC